MGAVGFKMPFEKLVVIDGRGHLIARQLTCSSVLSVVCCPTSTTVAPLLSSVASLSRAFLSHSTLSSAWSCPMPSGSSVFALAANFPTLASSLPTLGGATRILLPSTKRSAKSATRNGMQRRRPKRLRSSRPSRHYSCVLLKRIKPLSG